MSPLTEKIAVLLAFGLVMLLLNLQAGSTWLKLLSLLAMLAAFTGAAWFTVELVTRG